MGKRQKEKVKGSVVHAGDVCGARARSGDADFVGIPDEAGRWLNGRREPSREQRQQVAQ